MSHVYTNEFYDYIDRGARSSAEVVISVLQPHLQARSVLDLGSGRGVWLSEWRRAGVMEVAGVDGGYVDRTRLAIPEGSFHPADLTQPVSLGRRFDLAQSLEVGEHLPESAAARLVESLTAHSDRVLFSAAVPGQGGEFHINEQPLSFWQELFAAQGYTAFDYVRPRLAEHAAVEPWYRYNSVLYLNAAGRAGLSGTVLETEIPAGRKVPAAGSLGWRLRRAVVSLMPQPMVTRIAQARAAALVRRARRLQGAAT